MVNERQLRLISCIRKHRLSGEALASIFGVSRVAIWKMVQSLTAQGFDISTNADGYMCADDYYDLSSVNGYSLRYHFETTTTMDAAIDFDKEASCLVLAETQSRGRGRRDRIWLSSRGGLYFTIVSADKIPSALLYRAIFAMTLAIASSIHEYHIAAKVKWPNDVLVEDRKIAGVLARFDGDSDTLETLSIGAGVNLNNSALPPAAVSLSSLLGNQINRSTFLEKLLCHWNEYRALIYEDTIDSLWQKHSATIGHHVRIVQDHRVFEGLALSLAPGGALLVKNGNSKEHVFFGDCYHE